MPFTDNIYAKSDYIKQHILVLKMAAPIILANLSVPLLGFVDTAVMGHLPHAYFLGAVAIGATIMQFIYWGFGFLRMGTTGLTAQAYGANQSAEVRLNFQRAALLALIIGLLLWLLKSHIIDFSLYLFEASRDVEDLARTYFNIRIWSAPAALINYCLIGWFIGVQQTRIILILQVWMNLINIILDLIFVVGFSWGVEGVALATVIAEVSAASLGIYFYLKKTGKDGIIIDYAKLLNSSKLQRMIAINLNIFLRTFCLIFAFAYFTSEAAKFGDNTLAANAILLQFIHFLSFGLDGFAQAAETLIGGALGERNRNKYRMTVKVTMTWAIGISLIYTVFYWLFGSWMIDLFTNNESVRVIANQFLIWVIILPFIAVWAYMLDGIFIGATRSADMRNGMAIALAIFIVSIFILKSASGYQGLWISLIIFMGARGITLGFTFPNIEKSLKVVAVADTN
ncbi:MAG TPA: MATE family efflux transporter [Rhodospirillales bacterium]|nr:MATE family efflux transporter [Rhodospirillales bacterium]